MLFDFKEIPARECYKLLVSTVTPRPIAWVVSQDGKGVLNAGAFSFFNAFSGDPPVVAIGVGSHHPGRPKDTRANILETGQFVVNLVSEANAEQMNITAIEFDPSVNELEAGGIDNFAFRSRETAAHCGEPGRHGMRTHANRGLGRERPCTGPRVGDAYPR